MDGKGHDADDCLRLVERSPAAVRAHDKQAWLALFAIHHVVEDPVGSTPHRTGVPGNRGRQRGAAPLSRFYDTFIAANDIRFHVDRNIVCGLHVVRDLTIEIAMSPQVTVHVPMHLLYELTEEGGELRISRLAAHWELWPMLRQQQRVMIRLQLRPYIGENGRRSVPAGQPSHAPRPTHCDGLPPRHLIFVSRSGFLQDTALLIRNRRHNDAPRWVSTVRPDNA